MRVTSCRCAELPVLLQNEMVAREFEPIPTIEHAPIAVAHGV